MTKRTLILVLACALQAQAQDSARVQFATSRDGTRIAYDVSGSGPTILLLHGGGQNRGVWHRAGYVARLAPDFRVITVDIRGNGQSDKPTDSASYSIERLMEDFDAVATATVANDLSLWGFSYGANVGRYWANRSTRVKSMVYIGIPFGPAVGARFKAAVDAMPNPPVWVKAMLGYSSVEPGDMKVPTLWLVGTANVGAMESVTEYRGRLAGTRVTLELLEGLNHPQELDRIDVALPKEVAFTSARR